MEQIISSIQYHARVNPDDISVIAANKTISYGQMSRMISDLSLWLSKYVFNQIGILASNSVEWIVFDLACINCKKSLIPLPVFFSPSQISDIIQQADIRMILVEESCLEKLRETLTYVDIDETPFQGYKLVIIKPAQTMPARTNIKPSKITFTSGSTGYPKGVCLSYEMLERVLLSIVEHIPSTQIMQHLCILPFSILLENLFGIYAVLYLGKTLIIPDESIWGISSLAAISGEQMGELFKKYAPNSLIMMPAHLEALIKGYEHNRHAFDSLTFGAVGGAHVNPSLLENALEYSLPVYEGYGLSECGSIVSLNTPQNNKIGSAGKILPHVEYAVSEENELIVYAPIMTGYMGQTDTMTQVNTGDLVEIDENGYLTILGRKKNIIINAYGRNISPEWIESELLKQKNIAQAAIFGDGESALSVAIYTDHQVKDHEIISSVQAVNARLPNYAQIKKWTRSNTKYTHANGLLARDQMPLRENIYEIFKESFQQLN